MQQENARKDKVDSLKFVVIDVPIKSHNHCSHLHPGRLFISVRKKKKPNCPHTSLLEESMQKASLPSAQSHPKVIETMTDIRLIVEEHMF
jgi:hypothetical protein